MIFSSLLFLFRFLPVVLILYYAVPARFRNLVLLLVSLVFYAWGEPVYVLLMLVSILISWLGGYFVSYYKERGNERKAKLVLLAAVAAGLGLLGYFKYADFAIRSVNALTGAGIPLLELALPIGISFYTFQTISYVIDVYRGSARVQKSILSYGAYVSMFPQLIAGPIVQYKTIDEQLRCRHENSQEFAMGAQRFVVGLGKKVLLANNAGLLWDYIRVMQPEKLPAVMAWIGILAYTFQIYFDFSAYSDMAIGLGHMFGFSFLENFRYPYESRSVSEFWRRWHISLGTWFKEYVYIPLGGSRRGRRRMILSTAAVWALTGIWHGADWNFVLWGVYYGILLLLEKFFLQKYLDRLPGWLQHVYCMLLVMFGWYIFAFTDVTGGIGYLKAMFGLTGAGLVGGETGYILYNYLALLVVLVIGCTRFPVRGALWLKEKLSEHETVLICLESLFMIGVFLLSVAYLVDASYNPFLYFRF